MKLYILILCIFFVNDIYCLKKTGDNGEQDDNKDLVKKKYKLADDPNCADDIKKYCRGDLRNNFVVLECLSNDLEDDEELSKSCQHAVWSYKQLLSSNTKLEDSGRDICEKDLNKISECHDLTKKYHLIPCLIENFDKVEETPCQDFLNKMELFVFSDYRLVYKFVDRCLADIEKFSCGRLADEDDPLPHDQGKTITCLMEKERELAPDCKKEILHIAELQSGDFKKDRQLYQACKEDRERFCKKVKSGEGRVFKCLFEHKFNEHMSEKCREKLTLRQKLEQDDFKINYPLSHNCEQEIRINKCLIENNKLTEEAHMSIVLLCLENAVVKGNKVSSDCHQEITEVRRELMEDYQISPEVILTCQKEIKSSCNGMERKGKTLHCLLGLVQKNSRLRGKKEKSTDCDSVLIPLLCVHG